MLITGSSLNGAAGTKGVKMRLLREAPVSLKPLIAPALISATDNIGVLANTLRDVWAVSLELPDVVNENKPGKLKHYLTCDKKNVE